jgi:membrane-bound metal-dependent hydrolase YbcI (DUF457 family)
MPFTPYHFGPSACLGLPLKKSIDIPVFVLVNVVVDFEPLAVILFDLDYPLHGFFHTFLIGGLLGLTCGILAFPARNFFKYWMQLFHLPYQTNLIKMIVSGILGVWFHILLDGVLYGEMHPFWPIAFNPLHQIISYSALFSLCEVTCIAAIVIYPARAYCIYRKKRLETITEKVHQQK